MNAAPNNKPGVQALDPEPLPLLPLLYGAAVLMGVIVVTTSLGVRDGILALLFAGSILLTRLPRALPTSALLLIVVAVLGVLAGHGAAPAAPTAASSTPVTRTVTVQAPAPHVRHGKR